MRNDEVRDLMRQGAARGLAEAALLIQRQAKHDAPKGDPNLDPDPSLSLEQSIKVDVDFGGRVVTISSDLPYSAKQHEDLRLKHPRGGGPKFLEKNLLAMVPKLDGIVAGEVRKQMTGRR